MFFGGFVDLTSSFNSAIGATAEIGTLGVTAATIFSLADDKNDDVAPLKAVAKLSLMGRMF